MNIKTRLSFQFTFLVFGILIFFSLLVYYFSYTSQRSKFRDNLFVKAENTAILLINVEEVDSTLLKIIHQTTRSFEDEEIAITDAYNKIIYSNKLHFLSHEILNDTTISNTYFFSIHEKDGVAYTHNEKNQIHRVFVMAHDTYRDENLKDLRIILIWAILFSLWLSVSASYFFSKIAIRPISKIISEVKEISSSKLSSRLEEGDRKDEIEQLAITFNEMLSDLEIVFKSQDEFVSNASHELRTPLAIMIAESDYIISRERKPEEYTNHISGLIGDLKRLNQLLNSLLEMAHINRDKVISKEELRIDELIFSTIESIKLKYPERKILPKIKYTENEKDIKIEGNGGLLEIAFKNIIENACKFSSGDVDVTIESTEDSLLVTIKDHGIGIPISELDHIFKPFNRGTNAKYIGGFGVGLSIVQKIIELHSAIINVSSVENKGTTFSLKFRKLS